MKSQSTNSPGIEEPFLLYEFSTKKKALSALLELPCIHLATDSKKLICTEVLGFGYYKCKEDGKYETLLCGEDMTLELWKQAETCFPKNGGRRLRGLKPEKETGSNKKEDTPRPDKVVFVRKDSQNVLGVKAIYEVYKGPDAASAKAFLEKKPVTKRYYCMVVETPDGTYCRDIQGFYKE